MGAEGEGGQVGAASGLVRVLSFGAADHAAATAAAAVPAQHVLDAGCDGITNADQLLLLLCLCSMCWNWYY